MNIQDRIEYLRNQHVALDKKIDNIEKTGLYQDTVVREMKKARLQLRDEIAILEQQHKDHK
jgi:uncharacterized protein YdcH (DUF465 family)